MSVLFLVPKINVGDQCFVNDICADGFAECNSGVCECTGRSLEQDGQCSKFKRSKHCDQPHNRDPFIVAFVYLDGSFIINE